MAAHMPVEVVPAVLAKSFEDLQTLLSKIKGMVPLVQIDVVDGFFSPNQTWPYADDASFEQITAGAAGLPFWEHFDFEFDLMIVRPGEEVRRYISAGATRLVLHAESPGVDEALAQLQSGREAGEFAVEVGIALLPTARAKDLAQFAERFDFIQVMGIDNVGYQHQTFNPEALALVEELRHSYPNYLIQVDGGANIDTARSLAHAGANRLIVGSAIFGSLDPRMAIEALRKEANH